MDRRVRVLIADDRPATRQGLRALLALLPRVEVIGEAADGRESVDLVAEYGPDVVLMDMQMPVMDGLEATRRIKKQWPEVKVIALTMYAGHRAEALAAGQMSSCSKMVQPTRWQVPSWTRCMVRRGSPRRLGR